MVSPGSPKSTKVVRKKIIVKPIGTKVTHGERSHEENPKMATLATELRGKKCNHYFEFGLRETRQRLEIKGVEHHF